MDNWLPTFNQITLGIFFLLVMAGLGRMFLRAGRLRRAGLGIGPILKRDIGLFSVLVIIFGVGGFIARILHIVVSTNPLWVVPTSLAALTVTAHWVWVEWHLEAK